MELNKKGLFFSVDALIAVMLIFFVAIIYQPPPTFIETSSEIESDIVHTMSNLKVADVDNSFVQQLILDGNITDLNDSLLQTFGEFAVTDKPLATQFLQEVLNDLDFPENVGVWIFPCNGSQTCLIYSDNRTPVEEADNVEIERQYISGLQEGESVTGFSARAFLESSYRTNYVYFGGYVGDGNITIDFEANGSVVETELELAVNNDFEVYINNVSVGNYAASPSSFQPVSYTIGGGNFTNGTNVIELRGEALYVAGGFFKFTSLKNVQYEQNESRYDFPGIVGLVNLYDGIYIPDNLTSMEVYLHINSTQSPFYLVVGNTTLLNMTTNDEEIIFLNSSNISSLLNYSLLEEKNVPLRLGLEDVELLGIAQEIDVVSVADLSGSMGAEMNDLKNSTKALIDVLLNASGNRVGLAGFRGFAKKADFHNLSMNNASLNNIIDNSWNANGGTCICCGILKAISCYDPIILNDSFNGQNVSSRPAGWNSGVSWALGFGYVGTVNITDKVIEGDRSVLMRRFTGGNNVSHIAYLYRNFPPQQDALDVSFMFNHSFGNGRMRLDLVSSDSSGGGWLNYINLSMYNGWIRNNNLPIVAYNLNQIYNVTVKVVPGSSTYDLYMDDILVGNDLSVSTTRDNLYVVYFRTETNESIDFTVDNIKVNLTNHLCDGTSLTDRFNSIIVMSDGDPTHGCGIYPQQNWDGDWSTTNDPQDQAVEAACIAHERYGMTVYSIGLGAGANNQTMVDIADCGGGRYYSAIDSAELYDIYQQVAQNITSEYYEQTFGVAGDLYSKLFSDSYISFKHEKQQDPFGLVFTLEDLFNNNYSGSFNIPADADLVEARVTSYSGSRWTDKVILNDFLFYNLSSYGGEDYERLGDPYNLRLDNGLITVGDNYINLTTGTGPGNSTAGSQYNKVIYTLLKNATSFTDILAKANGCVWSIQFEDDSVLSGINIPMNHSLGEQCYYNSTVSSGPSYCPHAAIDYNDAVEVATCLLFNEVDVDDDGRLDFYFTEQDLQIDLDQIEGVPFESEVEILVKRWTP